MPLRHRSLAVQLPAVLPTLPTEEAAVSEEVDETSGYPVFMVRPWNVGVLCPQCGDPLRLGETVVKLDIALAHLHCIPWLKGERVEHERG